MQRVPTLLGMTIVNTKTCTKCEQSKPVEDFKKKKGKPSSYCKPCFRKHYNGKRCTKGLYTRDPITKKTSLTSAHKLAVKKTGERRNNLKKESRAKEYVRSILQSTPCTDCGENDIVVLEFDHREPSQKFKDISRLMKNGAGNKLREEIAKCDVVCANCHRKRTAKVFGNWRLSL